MKETETRECKGRQNKKTKNESLKKNEFISEHPIGCSDDNSLYEWIEDGQRMKRMNEWKMDGRWTGDGWKMDG